MDVPVYAYFVAAMGWAGLCANVIVIPFFSKSETIFKDLIDSGARDLALTNIDAQRLLPELARLIEEANRVRDQHARKGESVEYEELLQEVDFVPYIERAQAAIGEKRWIEQSIDELRELAQNLWRRGVAHAVSVIFLPFSLLLPSEFMRVAAMFVLAIVIGTSAMLIFSALKHFSSIREELYTALGRNRG